MKKTSPLLSIFPIFLALVVAGCATSHGPAPVVDLVSNNGANRGGTDATAIRSAPAAGYYTVKKGDTLLHIANEFGQSLHDLVGWNQLANPNDIRVDQVLRIIAPNGMTGTGAAQTGSVATGSGVEVRPLNVPSASSAPVPAGVIKSGPRGDKRPYSEAALAELQKAEPAVVAAPAARIELGKPAETRTPAEKISEGAGAAEESIAFIWPTEGKVVGRFDDGKKGLDIAGKSGQAIVAAAAGKVMYAGSGIRGYGNLVIVKHSNNLLSAYAHNKSILVKEGQIVVKGEKIAEMGNSDADSVKLHFEIRQQGKPVDPSKFLPAK